jgi:hypothetical protein
MNNFFILLVEVPISGSSDVHVASSLILSNRRTSSPDDEPYFYPKYGPSPRDDTCRRIEHYAVGYPMMCVDTNSSRLC